MSLFGSLGISGSGMTAERLRMDVVSENLANANTTRGVDGQPYRRKQVVLEQAQGKSFGDHLAGVTAAAIVDDPSPAKRVYDPGHPDADAQGYVTLPNVNTVSEMVDLITASRGYEANVQAMNATKQIVSKTLDLLR
jgi:flagellar basal-body rod protein FlgC